MGTRNFHWDPVNDCVLTETDESGDTIVTYTHEPGQFGPLLSETRDGTTFTHHYDAVGSTTMLTDDAGTVTDTFEYDAWGNVVERTGTTPTPYQWVGRWGYQYDVPTDGYYVRARSYQPTISRWTSVDPAVAVARLYIYAGNSPELLIDQSGLIQVKVQADAFIPPAWIWFGGPFIQLKGDNRGISASPQPPEKSRVTSYIVVELEKCLRDDPKIAGGDAISVSTRSFFGIQQTALGSVLSTETAERTGPCSVDVKLRTTGRIPFVLAGAAPSIDYEFKVKLSFGQISAINCDIGVSASPSGMHDGYPAYELYVGSSLVYSTLPVGTPLNLFPPMDVNVHAQIDTLKLGRPECCCCIPLGCSTVGAKPC